MIVILRRNIYKDYDENLLIAGKVGQGNKTAVFIADIQGGYLINPSTNLKLLEIIFTEF
jgi:hypothetical protein